MVTLPKVNLFIDANNVIELYFTRLGNLWFTAIRCTCTASHCITKLKVHGVPGPFVNGSSSMTSSITDTLRGVARRLLGNVLGVREKKMVKNHWF